MEPKTDKLGSASAELIRLRLHSDTANRNACKLMSSIVTVGKGIGLLILSDSYLAFCDTAIYADHLCI